MTFNYEIMCPRSCHFVLLMLLFLLLILWLNLVWRRMKVIDLGDHLGYFQSRLKSFLYFLKKMCFLYFGNWKFLKDLFSSPPAPPPKKNKKHSEKISYKSWKKSFYISFLYINFSIFKFLYLIFNIFNISSL